VSGLGTLRDRRGRLIMRILKVLGIVVVVAGLGLTVAGVVANFYGYGEGGFPRCDSRAARDEVNRVVAQAPIGRVRGISIVAYDSVATVSTTPERVVCSASALLNDSTTRNVTYQFWKRGSDMMVEFRFE